MTNSCFTKEHVHFFLTLRMIRGHQWVMTSLTVDMKNCFVAWWFEEDEILKTSLGCLPAQESIFSIPSTHLMVNPLQLPLSNHLWKQRMIIPRHFSSYQFHNCVRFLTHKWYHFPFADNGFAAIRKAIAKEVEKKVPRLMGVEWKKIISSADDANEKTEQRN